MAETELPSLGTLFSRTTDRFRAGWAKLTVWWLAQLACLAALLGLLAAAAFGVYGLGVFEDPRSALEPMKLGVFGALAGLVLLGVGLLWTRVALAWNQAALHPEQDLGAQWQATAGLTWAATWAWGLILPLYLGLLACLLVPALLAFPYMALAPLLFLAEKRRGLDGFWAGRDLARGRWWALAGPLLVVHLLNGALGSLPIAGQAASLLFGTSFIQAFTVELYLAARASRPARRGAPSSSTKLLLASGWGWLLLLAGLALAAWKLAGLPESQSL